MPYGSKLHIPPTNYHPLAAQQEPYKNSLTPDEQRWREKVRKWQDTERQRTSDERDTETQRDRGLVMRETQRHRETED